ncbi:MAG: hypothetical protein ACLSVX_01935 [Massilimicrobiota timonensis]
MKLLNTKSAVFCNENELEQHNTELLNLQDKILYKNKGKRCGVLFPDGNTKEYFNEFLSACEYVDFSNGIDIFEDDNKYALHCYGQCYVQHDKIKYHTQTIYVVFQ